MPSTEAQSEGLAALERAVKLFPINLLSRSGASRLTAALACSSVSFGDRQSLSRSIEYSRKNLELSGPTPETIRGIATLYKALETIEDRSAESLIDISVAQLVSVLRTHGELALQSIADSWDVLEHVRPGRGSDLATTVSEFTENWVGSVQKAAQAAFVGMDSWPTRAQVIGRVEAFSRNTSYSIQVLHNTVSLFGMMEARYPLLHPPFARARHVIQKFDPARWSREILPKKEEFIPFKSPGFWYSFPVLILIAGGTLSLIAGPRQEGLICCFVTTFIVLWPLFCASVAAIRNRSIPHQDRTRASIDQVIHDLSP